MNSLIQKTVILAFLIAFSINSKAQTKTNGVAIGFKINQVQKDFGIGLDIISPYFVNDMLAIRLGASYNWLEYVEKYETTWTPYQSFQLGIRGRQFIIEDKLFVYGEGGSLFLLPNNDFSSVKTEFGGYGLFGFEFKFANKYGYYFEMGGVGTNATADKVVNKPIYSNGLLMNVGFRAIF